MFVTKDKRGVITISSRQPPRGTPFRIIKHNSPRYSKIITSRGWRAKAFSHTRYDSIIQAKASEHQVEPALVKAVIHAESAFNPRATSPKGAMGLMQLMPATAARFGVRNAYQPEDNVAGGVRYLKVLLDRYNGDLRRAVAAYNAGEGAVDASKDIPPYAETRTYVRRVLDLLPLYRSLEAKAEKKAETQ